MTWVDPERDITVTCGSTEAMIAAMLGVLDPGDEVVVFEPFYENYGPDTIISGAVPRTVTLARAGLDVRRGRARGGVQRAHARDRDQHAEQPDGQGLLPRGARRDRGALPEVGRRSCSPTRSTNTSCTTAPSTCRPGAVPGLEDRTVTISALSKTYAVTGWRVGWVVAPAPLSRGIRSVHDFLTVAAPAPLQEAGETALSAARGVLPADGRRVPRAAGPVDRDAPRDRVQGGAAGGRVLRDGRHLGLRVPDDVRFARHMVEDVGVAVVPGSSFFSRPELGAHLVRFAFCKKLETLKEAGERLRGLHPRDVR